MKTIMFDVDGVLADFVDGFTRLGHDMFGTPRITTLEQKAWDDFPGMTKNMQDAVWKRIANERNFWADLPPLVNEAVFDQIQELSFSNNVVFCTNRGVGWPSPQFQTARFLAKHGIMRPNVVISKRKGDIAKAIDADFALDDKPENAACIHWIADVKPCQSYILTRPYNREADLPKNVRRVDKVEEFLRQVTR